MKKYICFVLLLLKIASAQDPSDVNWKEINTEHYRIIFPEEIYSHANRISNRMEYIYPKVGFYLQDTHKKIPLILSNRSVEANGYVTLAPRRSEWYSMPWPGKTLNVGDWHNMLSIHETRHIFQVDFANRGIGGLGKIVFGEMGHFAGMYYTFPEWYIEGDAVVCETLLSESGRGRSANFQQAYRTMVLTDQRFKYEKARFGSYKDAIPDHYEMGYFMTTFVGRNYGYDKWKNILEQSTDWWMLNPFSPINGGINKYTDYQNSESLYKAMYHDLFDFWKDDFQKDTYTNGDEIISRKDKYFTDYIFPYIKNEDEIIYIKTGLANQTAIHKVHKGKSEKLLYIPNFSKYYGLDIKNNLIVLTQYSEDKRWNKQSWSELAIHNMKSGKTRQITKKGKFINPALSNDEKMVVAVEFTNKRECSLVVMMTHTGNILQKIPAPNNEMIHYPSWSQNDDKIVFTATGFSGRALFEYALETKELSQLSEYSREDIFRPKYWGNYILYESGISGVENIYAFSRRNGKRFQVTSRKFGAAYPTIFQNILVFSDYTSDGYKLVKMTIDSTQFLPLQKEQRTNRDYFQPLLTKSFQPILEEDIPVKQHEYEDYHGFGKYFNYHSWSTRGDEHHLGLELVSDNILGTMSHSEYFVFDTKEKSFDYGAKLNLLKFYPKITANINREIRHESKAYSYSTTRVDKDWKEINFSLLADLPLYRQDFGISTKLVNLNVGLGYKNLYDIVEDVTFNNEKIGYIEQDKSTYPVHFSLHAVGVDEKSLQAIVPNFCRFSLIYNRAVGNPNLEGNQKVFDFSAGINMGNKNGIIVAMQAEDIEDMGYGFDQFITQPAIFNEIYSPRNMRIKTTLKHHLWYPDLDFFYFLYVKRFVLDLSIDFFNVDDYVHNSKSYFSGDLTPVIGVGLTSVIGGIFDFRIHVPITVTYYRNYYENYNGIGIGLQY